MAEVRNGADANQQKCLAASFAQGKMHVLVIRLGNPTINEAALARMTAAFGKKADVKEVALADKGAWGQFLEVNGRMLESVCAVVVCAGTETAFVRGCKDGCGAVPFVVAASDNLGSKVAMFVAGAKRYIAAERLGMSPEEVAGEIIETMRVCKVGWADVLVETKQEPTVLREI